uniref:N-acetylglucosaminylphosphatidylinositol deacetylase n=1 Tax=Strigamia maritima TaxID=126957 RepID=T1J5C2_STRMM
MVSTKGMLHVILPVFVLGFSMLFHFIVSNLKSYKNRKDISGVHRVLFVIAHPDDECMFFGPTVVQLHHKGCELHLLCLSSGNYYQRGSARKRELRASCEILGIDPSYVTVIEHTKMPDNPKVKWRDDLVGNIILKQIMQLDIDTVITFDRNGVSGHSNHVALYCGVSYLCRESLLPSSCKIYTLHSVSSLRKYIGVIDVPFSYLFAQAAYTLSHKDKSLPKKAMFAHSSQMLWFRWFYVYLSRYMIINTYSQLELPSDEDPDSCASEDEKLD